jgi:hypothetical protein
MQLGVVEGGSAVAEAKPSGKVTTDLAMISRLPPTSRPDLPSVFAFGLKKCATVMVDRVLAMLTERLGMGLFSPHGDLWNRGVPPWKAPEDSAGLYRAHGYAYGVFRFFPTTYEVPLLLTNRSVLQVRDPRDILVSHYYSMAWSHPRPTVEGELMEVFDERRARARSIDVDEHVLEWADWLAACFDGLEPLLASPLCRVFRYEDIIFDKRAWLDRLIHHFGWEDEIDGALRDSVIEAVDIRPGSERPSSHIRSVKPGNHREKLRAETIAALDERFAPVLDRYCYAAV